MDTQLEDGAASDKCHYLLPTPVEAQREIPLPARRCCDTRPIGSTGLGSEALVGLEVPTD